MKSKKKIMHLVATLCLLFIVSFRVIAQSKSADASMDTGFAVLELFTSEGCSSCPPAEALLEQIDQSSSGKPVYVLAFHVDYWDMQGWKDAFSDHRFSIRQYQYSQLLSSRVYTPQLVINGSSEGVGANPDFVNEGISQALASKTQSSLKVNVRQNRNTGMLQYTIQGESGHVKLVVAIVQKHAISHVLRGENKGRTLSHAAIVRDLQTFSLNGHTNGNISLHLPPNFNQHDWDIVSFLQDPETGRITAANRASII